jgi:CBS domain containing-hemolysin-like protein
MTPRTVMFSLPEDMSVAGVLKKHPQLRFSRIPVYGVNHDDVTGFVLKNDILLQAAGGEGEQPLAALKRPIAVIPAVLPLRELFERLLNERTQLALAVDEYGGTAGLVTQEDLIETLLGLEIVDEADTIQDMQQLARQKWLERARRLGVVIDEKDVPR